MAKSNFSIKAIRPGVEASEETRYFGRAIHVVYIARPFNDYRQKGVLIAGSVLFPTSQCYGIIEWLNGDGSGSAQCNEVGTSALNRYEQGYKYRIERDKWGRSKLVFLADTTGLCLDYDMWLYETVLRHTKTPIVKEWFENPKFKALILKEGVRLSCMDRHQPRAILFDDEWSADQVVKLALQRRIITCN